MSWPALILETTKIDSSAVVAKSCCLCIISWDDTCFGLIPFNIFSYLYCLCRKRLFNMINDLPTIYEAVTTGASKKQSKEKSAVSNHGNNKPKSNPKVGKSFSISFFKSIVWIKLLLDPLLPSLKNMTHVDLYIWFQLWE